MKFYQTILQLYQSEQISSEKKLAQTVEPPNNGHIGTFQLSLVERLSSSRRSIYTQNAQLGHFCLSIIGGCPYLGMSFIGGSTIYTLTVIPRQLMSMLRIYYTVSFSIIWLL